MRLGKNTFRMTQVWEYDILGKMSVGKTGLGKVTPYCKKSIGNVIEKSLIPLSRENCTSKK